MDLTDLSWVDEILAGYGHKHTEIIGIMQDIQARENYLPLEVLQYVAKKLEISPARIYDIATFYKAFSLKPRGRHIVKVCCGTACHLGGAAGNLEQLNRTLHITDGETTDDRLFSIETVNCLGACALAPVVVVGEDYYETVNAGRMEKIITSYRAGEEVAG